MTSVCILPVLLWPIAPGLGSDPPLIISRILAVPPTSNSTPAVTAHVDSKSGPIAGSGIDVVGMTFS